jgi:hypothetical protein
MSIKGASFVFNDAQGRKIYKTDNNKHFYRRRGTRVYVDAVTPHSKRTNNKSTNQKTANTRDNIYLLKSVLLDMLIYNTAANKREFSCFSDFEAAAISFYPELATHCCICFAFGEYFEYLYEKYTKIEPTLVKKPKSLHLTNNNTYSISLGLEIEDHAMVAVIDHNICYIMNTYGDVKALFFNVIKLEKANELLNRIVKGDDIIEAITEFTGISPLARTDYVYDSKSTNIKEYGKFKPMSRSFLLNELNTEIIPNLVYQEDRDVCSSIKYLLR